MFKIEHDPMLILKLWCDWILFDVNQTGDTTTQEEYIDLILFINNYYFKKGLNKNSFIKINKSNFTRAWFFVERNFCKKSMLEFNTQDNFDIVVKNNKYVFRNLTTIKKS